MSNCSSNAKPSGESPTDLSEIDPDALADGVHQGIKQFNELLADLPRQMENVAKQIGKMNRSLGQLPIKMKRARLVKQLGADVMSEDSIMARRTGMAVKAKKATSLGDDTRKRQPKFMCPEHRERLVFSKLNQVWECPSPGCTKTKLPEMDRTETTIIKSEPRVICKVDEDGDQHWYLNYMDENIMIELPFSKATGAITATSNGATGVMVSYETENVAMFDAQGNRVDLDKAVAPEDDELL